MAAGCGQALSLSYSGAVPAKRHGKGTASGGEKVGGRFAAGPVADDPPGAASGLELCEDPADPDAERGGSARPAGRRVGPPPGRPVVPVSPCRQPDEWAADINRGFAEIRVLMGQIAETREELARTAKAAWDDGWEYSEIARAVGIRPEALRQRVYNWVNPPRTPRRPKRRSDPARSLDDWAAPILACRDRERDLTERQTQTGDALTETIRSAWDDGWSYLKLADHVDMSARELQRRASGDYDARRRSEWKRSRRRAAKETARGRR